MQLGSDCGVSDGRNVDPAQSLQRLRSVLSAYPRLAVAISGGVDSLTLAAIAHDVLAEKVLLVHACSPAVPQEATKRVKELANAHGWPLQVVDAGEFDDQRYRNNPVDRCYYCKTNLYARLSEVWDGPMASGANMDDLGDYRPGLLAAKERHVVHPLIDANINKLTVRALARQRGLDSVADLPAQPCLSSRVETGITINTADLIFVHRVETYLAGALSPGDIRCRIVASGVRIEVPEALIERYADTWPKVRERVVQMIRLDGRVFAGISAYERGSAFLHKPSSI